MAGKVVKYIKLSDLLKVNEIPPFLVGAFLSRIMETEQNGQSYFYAYSSFRSSKAVRYNQFDFKGYAEKYVDGLDELSGYKNWVVASATDSKIEVRFYVLNDRKNLGFTKGQFYTFINKQANMINAGEDEMSEDAKAFIRGFIELRGAIDTSAKFIADDLFSENRYELKKPYLLTEMMGVPIQYINFNPRNLQPQYVSCENQRNSQLRLDLFYYVQTIGLINDYKAKIFENAYSSSIISRTEKYPITYYHVRMPAKKEDNDTFSKRLNFYTNNLYNKIITPGLVQNLRNAMGLKTDAADSNKTRSELLKEVFKTVTPRKCAICGTTKTYECNSSGEQYFEIHHVISFKNGKDVDQLNNLVFLCPTCHRMMGKNNGTRQDRLDGNKKILINKADVLDFVSSYFGTDDIDELANLLCDTAG